MSVGPGRCRPVGLARCVAYGMARGAVKPPRRLAYARRLYASVSVKLDLTNVRSGSCVTRAQASANSNRCSNYKVALYARIRPYVHQFVLMFVGRITHCNLGTLCLTLRTMNDHPIMDHGIDIVHDMNSEPLHRLHSVSIPKGALLSTLPGGPEGWKWSHGWVNFTTQQHWSEYHRVLPLEPGDE